MPGEYTTADFLRQLLERCIGSVMIEWEDWGFPEPSFDRGYFNDRLKHSSPVNALTHKRMNRLFDAVFHPGGRTGRFSAPQAVDAANALVSLINEYFEADLSVWKCGYSKDNSTSYTHLLSCLDFILSLSEKSASLPVSAISSALHSYMEEVQSREELPAPAFPTMMTAAPYRQTECFVGRSAVTAAVTEHLIKGTSCLLHGCGGSGKTEIAKAVMKSVLETPASDSGITQVAWVSYTDGNFALSLARTLNVAGDIHNVVQAFQKAVSVINQYRNRLLLIIDNVETPDDQYLMTLSDYLDCRILMTSRWNDFPALKKFTVGPLAAEDCIALFYAFYHVQRDDVMLRRIIELTDCLPVAVELLSKIADAEEVPLYEFYGTLVRCGFNISQEEVAAAHEQMHSEARVIEQLKKLFRVYGCSQKEQILLAQISTIPNIRIAFEQARKWFHLENRTLLNRLDKHGWLKKETVYDRGLGSSRYSIHSVIASAVRAQFLDRLYELCSGFIREITVEMEDSHTQNDAVKKELIQFSWSLNDIFHGDFQSEDDCRFLWALAEIYRDIGYYERALPLLDSLSTLYTILYGEGCIQLASVWNSRGMIHYELSRFEPALEAYRNSRAILMAHLDPDDASPTGKTELAKLDLNIGKIWLKLDYMKAEPYFDAAYSVLEQEKGKNDHLTLNALGHRAMLMAHAGKLEEAEKIFLKIYSQIDPGSSDRELLFLRAGAAHHLGSMYTDSAPVKAMSFLGEARDIYRALLSPTHPDTLDVLNTICSLRLTTEDDYPAILSDLQQLLNLFIRAYGEKDPNVGTVYNNIGLCFYYMNQPEEAVKNYREAIKIDQAAFGGDHESTAYIYNNIGAVYSETDHPEQAIPEHERALAIYEAAYPDHMNLDLAATHADLADAWLREGDGDKVLEHLNAAFDIYDRMLPENARQLIPPYATLANLQVALGEYDEALESYSYAVRLMLVNGYSEDSQAVLDFTARIAEVKQMQERQSGAVRE